jgi:hypothetical protein
MLGIALRRGTSGESELSRQEPVGGLLRTVSL